MKRLNVGWIGTGVMGASMAKHLLKKNNVNLAVYNRTASKANEILSLENTSFKKPVEIAREADVLFLMLGYPHDVRNMVFGNSQGPGVLDEMKPGSIIVDHTTSTPSLAAEIAEASAKSNIYSVDAPVSGGDVGAKNGALVIMSGGHKEGYEKVKPLMDSYASRIEYFGGPGTGQHTKAANQIMIASTMIGTCEALVYGHKAGLPLDVLVDLLSGGGAGSFTLAKLAPRMLKRDFDPGFYVEHFVKDLGIALEEAGKMSISLPGTSLAQQFYIAMKSQGMERDGTQGLLKVLEQMNNVQVSTY